MFSVVMDYFLSSMPYMHRSEDFEERGLKIEKNCVEVRKCLLTQLTIDMTMWPGFHLVVWVVVKNENDSTGLQMILLAILVTQISLATRSRGSRGPQVILKTMMLLHKN